MQFSKKHAITTALAVLAILAFFTVRHFTGTEEAAIRRQLSTLEENVSRDQGDGNLSLSLKNQRLIPLFSNPCRLKVPRRDIDVTMTPREIASEIFRIHSRTQKISVDFYDTSVSLLSSDKASITTTVRLEVRGGKGNTFADSQEVRIELVKKEDEWLFTSWEQVEILEK